MCWAKRAGCYQPLTRGEMRGAVEALAAALLHRGLAAGERVLVLSENRPEWGIADVAIQSVGAWTVPVYPTLTTAEIGKIAGDCEPAGAVVSTVEELEKLRAIRSSVSSLRWIVVVEPAGTALASGEAAWLDALSEGQRLLPELRGVLNSRLEQLRPADVATLIYTSGTTGEPKGVMLSHGNFLSNAAACLKDIPIGAEDVHLSFLPLSHVFERMAGWYLMMMAGASVAYAESLDTVTHDMIAVRPTVMLGVPRFFEKLYARVQEGLAGAPPLKRRLAAWAMRIGRRTVPYRLNRQAMPWILQLQYRIAHRLVFQKLAARLGGRLRFFVSGSAPLSKEIGEFFYAAGIIILEGYGLTETSPVIAVNRPDALRFGTVGLPLDGVEVRLADDGELLTRGPHVMQGYYRRPDETRAVMADGWLRTGDIARIDAEGFISITDRKKDLIKTAGGKFVAPQKLENLFVTDPYVAQAFVYGDREPYCIALIVPNLARLSAYAREQGIAAPSDLEALVCVPELKTFLWGRIQALQRELPSFEQVKGIALLAREFSQAGGELTPTMKAKRTLIAAHYQDRIQQLYAETAAHGGSSPRASS